MGELRINSIEIEVAFALPEEQFLVSLKIPIGSRVADALALSGFGERFFSQLGENPAVGIFGKPVSAQQVLQDGDRVELYRDLLVDPKARRRNRAQNRRGKNSNG